MIQDLKELFTAYYDGEIKGCRPGSYAYIHETRHQQQMKVKHLEIIWKWLPSVTAINGAFVIAITFSIKDIRALMFGGFLIAPLTVFVILLEIDAHIYSIIHMIKNAFRTRDSKCPKISDC